MRQDRWFPGVLAMAIAVIAIASIFSPISYFTNIANAIVLPVFLLTVVEVVGHIKYSALRELHLELSRVKREEEWMRGYYAVAKEGKDEVSQKVVMEYEELCNNKIKLNDQIKVVSSWFKCYAPISIIFWVLLVCSALLGNLELVIRFSSGINVTTITLFTLSIFIGEPHITDFFVRIIRRKAKERADSSAI